MLIIYTPIVDLQKERLRNNPIYHHTQKLRDLGINLSKEEKDLYSENYRTLKKENPKDSIKKLLDLINEFGNVARYKINDKKFMELLYTNNELPERETKKQSHLPSHQKN